MLYRQKCNWCQNVIVAIIHVLHEKGKLFVIKDLSCVTIDNIIMFLPCSYAMFLILISFCLAKNLKSQDELFSARIRISTSTRPLRVSTRTCVVTERINDKTFPRLGNELCVFGNEYGRIFSEFATLHELISALEI